MKRIRGQLLLAWKPSRYVPNCGDQAKPKCRQQPNNSVNRTPKKLRFLGSLRAAHSGAGYVKR